MKFSILSHVVKQLAMVVVFLIATPGLMAQSAGNPLTLTWDTGATETGTQVAYEPATTAGSYYFRINTKSSEVWRTRLNVTSGEAQLYLMRGQIPVIGQTGVIASEADGSDGLVLSSSQFAPGENWYVLVKATGVSNEWSLVSGAPYVRNLGSLPYTDTNEDGSYTIGEPSQNAGVSGEIMPPEGVVFYKVTLPQNVPAWSLWLHGDNQLIGVRKSKVPVLFTTSVVADRKQNGSMLLVPPYLGQGSDSYFLSVVGMPGSEISLDSRIQQVESMPFDGAVPPFTVSDSPYKVFRVDVPSGQIVWDVSLNRLSGDPGIAIKKETVPSETENDAVNEAPGEVNDSISIVAPALTDGTWFVTVYATDAYETGLVNGPPVITDIGYRDQVTNDQPLRSGWRYYRVPDFSAQVGTLGWELALANAPPGTEIALRRAQIPGIWKKRTGGNTNLTEVKYADASSKNNILQRVDHEADIWYVGVYQPSLPLGGFTLTLDDILSTPVALDDSQSTVTNQVEGSWKYFRVVIPEDPNLLGWHLKLTDISGEATPKITVRRDRLPPSTSSVSPTATSWNSGAFWYQDADFTEVMKNSDATSVNGQQFLAAKGPNRPMVPGTYYVGVQAGGTPAAGSLKTASYTLHSRGIGSSYAIPVTPVALAGGSTAIETLAPRDFRIFSVTVPPGANLPSWQLDLTPTSGEMLMQVRRDSIPDFYASVYVGESPTSFSVAGGKRMKRDGKESLLLLPNNGSTSLDAGTYYITVVSEGQGPTKTNLGDGTASGNLTSTAPATPTDLGLLASSTPVAIPILLRGGESAIYRFSIPAGMKVLESYLTDRVGNPGISMVRGQLAPLPFPGTTSGNNGYGWTGGQTTTTHPVQVTLQDPVMDQYTLVVRANAETTGFTDGGATLNIRLIDSLPSIDPVNGTGSVTVTGQIAESWRYFTLNIPEHADLKGIRVSLKNVTSGVPRMIIRKGLQMPTSFTSTTTLNSDSGIWPDNHQWTQPKDFTGLAKDSGGVSTSGRFFLAAYNAPMVAGTYIIGVSKDSSINTVSQPNTPTMSYTLVAESIGDGLDIPIDTIGFNNSAAPEQIVDLPEREMKFFKVTVPIGRTSWQIHLTEDLTGGPAPGMSDGGLSIRRGNIPAFDSGRDPNARGGANVNLLSMGDHWALLPTSANGLLVPGDYYIAVTSFGAGPTTQQTGADPSTLTFSTKGELPVGIFPPLSEETAQILPFDLGPAEIAAYEFTVPVRAEGEIPYGLALNILRASGASNYSLRKVEDGEYGFPTPPGDGNEGYFGGLPAQASSSNETYGNIFAEIPPGTYQLIVRSSKAGSSYGNSSGNISARLLISSDIPELQFDGENLSITDAGATTDILQYRVEIPDEPNWQAWGIRLDGPISGRPGIIVRRAVPVESTNGDSVNSELIDWPAGYQWTQTDDFTKLKYDPLTPTGVDRDRSQQFFMASRESPLQPGTYYIGIDNRGVTTISPRTFTLRTFAVGDGYSIPLNVLSEPGEQAALSIPTPRMPAVFKITVPPLTKGWSVSLTPTLGDFTLRARYGSIPDPVNDTNYPYAKGGVHVQKSGDERITLLPNPGSDYLQEGDYYFMAVSEGQNSNLSSRILGTDEAHGTITNEGPVEVTDLGTVTNEGLARPLTLAAAEVRVFSVVVPEGINNLEFRLKDRSGEANIAVLAGTNIPKPTISESYGVFGGETAGSPSKDRSIVNMGNPAPGTYTIVVRAAGTLPSNYAPASATLAINIIKPSPLNFARELNEGNGLSNVDSRTLSDKEKFSYRVPIPSQIGGEDVLGWLLTVEQGNPIVRVYKSELDFGKTAAVTMTGRSALIVPPLLTFDTNWFIEVEGVGDTDYILRSQPVRLTAPPWTLPSAFNQAAGDSSPNEPDGLGIRRELPQDAWEFFALDVAPDNLGLMRLALEQYGGNTNIYIRNNDIPSPDHLSSGASGTKMFQYKMIAETSEAGNFSELSTSTGKPDRLAPGRWFIGVKSDPLGSLRTGSGYRLKAHSGVVTDLDLTTTAPLTDQNLAERDWRYYRFTVPRSGVPVEWNPFFRRISGSSVAYIRDTLPPFSYVQPTATNANNPSFVEWGSDAKNKAPTSAFPKAIAPGTISLKTPPLRPGSTYFLGIYGNTSGGSVEVSSSIQPGQLAVHQDMNYDSGTAQFNIPAFGSRLVRIATAADATRLKIECVQSVIGLSLKLEQGAPPYTNEVIAAHKQNSSPYPVSYIINQVLGSTWPFVANCDYYLLLTNTTAGPIDSTIKMLGSSSSTEDEDNDGMLDPWEILHFGNLLQTAGGDFDGDGSTNLQEFQNGTLPKDAASVLYQLDIASPGGSHSMDPMQPNYAAGEPVRIVATPAFGDTFRHWKSELPELDGFTSPTADIFMEENVQATAVFQTTLAKGLDTPPSMTLTDYNNHLWYGQYETSHDGLDAAASPALGTNQQSRFTTTLTGPGTLSFWWKVSSRAGSGVLTLMIDNFAQTTPAPISGTTGDWAEVVVDLPEGDHVVAWRYSRNSTSLTDGENRAYVDEVKFIPEGYEDYDVDVWLTDNFTVPDMADPDISGLFADPDGDGIVNLIEAAIGSAPKSPDSLDLLLSVVSTTISGSERTITLSANRAATPVRNLKLEIQACDSLVGGTWSTLVEKAGEGFWQVARPGVEQPQEKNAANGSVPLLVEESVDVSATDRRFYRLFVSVMPEP